MARIKESWHANPYAEEIETHLLCHHGCGQIAKYEFRAGKLCCSRHYNSCPGKRRAFSERTDHRERNEKSLRTRIETGATKSTGQKARLKNLANGTYQKAGHASRVAYAQNPWSNTVQCPILLYKDTGLVYQGLYEHRFLSSLETKYGLDWLKVNVRRGPVIWYIDPESQIEKMYISDYLIGNTVYEIKSRWTWDKHGTDTKLGDQNKAKLDACATNGYKVILVKDGVEIEWP